MPMTFGTYWTSSEGVGDNEVPTRGRLSQKNHIYADIKKH